MVSEEVKFKFNVGAAVQGQSVYLAPGDNQQNLGIQIFEEFKKYARSQGIEITSENLQNLLIEHPEILNLPEENQPSAVLDILLAKQEKDPSKKLIEEFKINLFLLEKGVSNEKFENLLKEVHSSIKMLPEDKQNEVLGSISDMVKNSKSETYQEQFNKEFADYVAKTTLQLQKPEELTESFKTSATQNQAAISNLFSKIPADQVQKPAENLNVQVQSSSSESTNKTSQDKAKTKPQDVKYFSEQVGSSFDSKSFVELPKDDMRRVFAEACAKNIYMYGSDSQDRTEEDWNNLSENEKQKFIKNAEKLADTFLNKSISDLGKLGSLVGEIPVASMQVAMLRLQAANENHMSLKEMSTQDSSANIKMVVSLIDKKAKTNPQAMSEVEKLVYEEAVFAKRVIDNSERSRGRDSDIGLSEVFTWISKDGDKNVNMATEAKSYLRAKVKRGEKLDEIEKLNYEILKKLPDTLLESYLTAPGPTKLEAIMRGHDDFKDKYKNASPEKKAEMKIQYLKEHVGDNPEFIQAAIKDAVATGNLPEAMTLLKYAKLEGMENTRKAILEATKGDNAAEISGILASEDGAKLMGEDYSSVVNQMKQNKKVADIKGAADDFQRKVLQNADDDSMVTISAQVDKLDESSQKITSEGIAQRGIEGTLGDEALLKSGQNIYDKADLEAQEILLRHTPEYANKEVGAATAMYGLENSEHRKELTEISTEENIAGQFEGENQVKIHNKVAENLENQDLFTKEEAIPKLQKLSDNIQTYEAKNQVAAHKTVSSSRYSEVVEYAAQNIYKYDKSVQAEALKVTYETGNKAAISAAMENYTKMDPKAQIEIASEVVNNQKFMNVVKEAMGEHFVKDVLTIRLIAQESEARIPKSERELMLEKWNSLSPAEKYNFMVSLSVKYLIKMSPSLRRRVLEYAQKDPDLMKRLAETYGIDLLGLSESPAVLGLVVRELWSNPDNRYQIAKMVCKNPDKYPTSVVEDCELLLAENNGIDENEFNKLASTEKRQAATDFTYAANNFEFGSSAQSGGSRNNRVLSSFNKINPNSIA